MDQTQQPSRALLATIRTIDAFTNFTGTLISWLAVPLVLGVGYEVAARYLFNAPTVWAYDLTYMLYAAIFMLGAAYALEKGAHIRTDFFWDTFSPRTKGIIDSISYLVFFFPSLAVLGLIAFDETRYAYVIQEHSDQSPWRPLLWPFRTIVPLTCALMMIQGVSEFLKSFYMARTGIELDHKEKVEI